MIKTKVFALLAIVAVVAIFFAGKQDTADQFYSSQIESIANMTQIDGTRITPDTLEGKMLILNFWASYDAISRINNFELIQLSEDFKYSTFFNGNGLSVISISLDKYKAPLRKAIETDGTQDFCHICDYEGLESQLAQSFDVNRPVNLLVDADGKIVARDFNVSILKSALEMLTCESCE